MEFQEFIFGGISNFSKIIPLGGIQIPHPGGAFEISTKCIDNEIL